MWRAAVALILAASVAAAEAPRRVVSTNLCTDQLALMLAAPGQLVSVSALAQDPGVSVMAGAAAALPANHGRAEEVFALRPDLVLAGQYTAAAGTALLSRLGIAVEVFPPARSFDDIRTAIRRMGVALGREDRAEAVLARFEADLAAVADAQAGDRPEAALYEAQGYTAGDDSLAGEMLAAAGFVNVARSEASLFLPLEELVARDPDLLVTGRPHAGASRAEELLAHPALRETAAVRTQVAPHWMCGIPQVTAEVARLARLRDRIGGAR